MAASSGVIPIRTSAGPSGPNDSLEWAGLGPEGAAQSSAAANDLAAQQKANPPTEEPTPIQKPAETKAEAPKEDTHKLSIGDYSFDGSTGGNAESPSIDQYAFDRPAPVSPAEKSSAFPSAPANPPTGMADWLGSQLAKSVGLAPQEPRDLDSLSQAVVSGSMTHEDAVARAKQVRDEAQAMSRKPLGDQLLNALSETGSNIAEHARGAVEGVQHIPAMISGGVSGVGKALLPPMAGPGISAIGAPGTPLASGNIYNPVEANQPDMRDLPQVNPPVAEQSREKMLAAATQSGIQSGMNSAWWARSNIMKMANDPILRAAIPGLSLISPHGGDISPELQQYFSDHGVANIPSGKPMETMSDKALDSDLLVRERIAQDQEQLAKGKTPWFDRLREITGQEPLMSPEELAKNGYPINPEEVSALSMFSDPVNWAFQIPGIGKVLGFDSILNPATGAILKNSGRLLDYTGKEAGKAAAGIYSGAAKAGELAGKATPQLIQMGTMGAGKLLHIPFLENELGGYLSGGLIGNILNPHGIVERATRVGLSTLGDLPSLYSKAAQPLSDAFLAQAEDLKNGTSLLASKGFWPNLTTRLATSGIKAGLIGAGMGEIGTPSPEQAGATEAGQVALGMGLGGLGDVGTAVRNRMFDSNFLTNPSSPYHGLGAKPFRYGTDKWLDDAHDAFMSTLDPTRNQILNDARQVSRNAWETYVLHDDAFDHKVNDLRRQGVIQDPRVIGDGVAINNDPEQSQVFIRGSKFDRSFNHELGHPMWNLLDPASQGNLSDLIEKINDPDKFTRNYTMQMSGGRASVGYGDLPTKLGVQSGIQQFHPDFHGMTQDSIKEEMGAEMFGRLFNGTSALDVTRDPNALRSFNMALGSVLNRFGIDPTTDAARSILGVKPSFTAALLQEGLVRNALSEKGAMVPRPTPGDVGVAKETNAVSGPPPVPKWAEGAGKPPVNYSQQVRDHIVKNWGVSAEGAENMVPEGAKSFREGLAAAHDNLVKVQHQARGWTPLVPNQEAVKDSVGQAYSNNYPGTDQDKLQQVLSGLNGKWDDLYSAVEKAMAGKGEVTEKPSVEAEKPETIEPTEEPQPVVAGEHGTTNENADAQTQLKQEGMNPGEAQSAATGREAPAETGVIRGRQTVFHFNYDGSPDMGDRGKYSFFGNDLDDKTLAGVAVPIPVLESQFGKFTFRNPDGTYGMLNTPEAQKAVEAIRRARVEVTGPDGRTVKQFPIVDVGPGVHTGNVLDMTLQAAKDMGITDNGQVSYKIFNDQGEPLPIAYHPANAILPREPIASRQEGGEPLGEGSPNRVGPEGQERVAPAGGNIPGTSAEAPSTGIPLTPEQRLESFQGARSVPSGVGTTGAKTESVQAGEGGAVHAPVEEPGYLAQLTQADVDRAEAEARAAVPTTTKRGQPRNEQTVTNEVLKNILDDIGPRHAASLPEGDTRVTYRNGYWSGTHFVPGDPVHDFLLQGASPYSKGLIPTVEGKIATGDPMFVDYFSAEHGGGRVPTGAERREAQIESTGAERAARVGEGQIAGKTLIPTQVGVTPGEGGKMARPYASGPSPDKINVNAMEISKQLGDASPYLSGNLGDPMAQLDLEGYLHNVSHGVKGTGEGSVELPPGLENLPYPREIPTPPPGFTPYRMDKAKADFWNLAVEGSGAGAKGRSTNKGKVTASGRARALAAENEGSLTPEGIVNPLHAKIEAQNPGWIDQNLHSAWEKVLLDNIIGLHDRPEDMAAPIHPGHRDVLKAMTSEKGGLPKSQITRAGFMPGELVEGPGGQLERIRSAAVRFGDKIFTGPTHYMAYMKAYGEGHDLPEGYNPNTEGFMTDSGRFIDRNEAWDVAKSAGQSNRSVQGHRKFRPETLASEDIAPRAQFMPGASTNGIGASVRTATTDNSEPNPGEWMTYPSTSREERGHIHAGTFEKNTGIKLSENPDKMIHPMGVLLGPRHANPRR